MKKITVILALLTALVFVFCACGEKIDDLPDITTEQTTTVPTPDTIAADLGIIMEIDDKAVTNLVYSKVDGKEIGQAEFTYNSKTFVFRASKTLEYSDIHGVTSAVSSASSKTVGTTEYTFITYVDGSVLAEWSRTIIDVTINYTLLASSAMTPDEFVAVIDATVLSNR